MKEIKFGTDGWRAVIADGYTFNNLNKVVQATSQWILDEEISENGVVIGYDARFLGREFAEYAASVFAMMQIPVRISDSIVPTPAVSWAAKHFNAVGIVITASHNPPIYNGFKVKAPYGGSASPDHITGIEAHLDLVDSLKEVRPFIELLREGLIRELDLGKGYLELIEENINLEAIRKSNLRIAHDPMFGAGQGFIKRILGDRVFEIHNELNPLFGGIAPEPIEENLKELPDFIVQNRCDIGIANDGDADRITMFDENGKFVSSHQILSLLVKYLHTEKKMDGIIVKTFSTSDMLDKQAEKYGLSLEVTPIGFKYVADIIINGNVLAGGEESGGLAVKGHLPERDGIYIGLLIAEMMATSGKTLSGLVQDLFDEFGPHEYYRNDILTEERKKNAMTAFCKAKRLNEIAGLKVVDWDFKDGIKHIMENGSWLLVRQSGTEPVLRIYAEAPEQEQARKLVDDVTAWVDNPAILNNE